MHKQGWANMQGQQGQAAHSGNYSSSRMIGATAMNKCRQATVAPAAATAANTNKRGWEGQMGLRAGEYEQRRIERTRVSNGGTSSKHKHIPGRRPYAQPQQEQHQHQQQREWEWRWRVRQDRCEWEPVRTNKRGPARASANEQARSPARVTTPPVGLPPPSHLILFIYSLSKYEQKLSHGIPPCSL